MYALLCIETGIYVKAIDGSIMTIDDFHKASLTRNLMEYASRFHYEIRTVDTYAEV